MPIDFSNNVPFKLTPQDMGQFDLMAALTAGQQFGQSQRMFPQKLQEAQLLNALKQVQAKYAEPMAQQALTKEQQFNEMYKPDIQSQIGLRQAEIPYYGAQTNKMNTMTPLEAQELKLKNQLYPSLTQSQIDLNRMGGRGMGTGAKEEVFFQSLIAKDNPHLKNDPQKIYEASNALREGRNTLPDGTPLNFSEASRSSLDRITKYGTTSPIITQGIQGAQAEAEMPIVKKYIDEGIKPYGTTVFGTSPQQIADSLNIKDHKAQERLGKYMGAQQLLYDRASLSLKMNALPPGVTIANHIKDLSYASVNEKFPTQSAESRQIASDIVAKALNEMLKARRSVQTGASSIRLGNSESVSNTLGNDKGTSKVQQWGRDENGNPVRIG